MRALEKRMEIVEVLCEWIVRQESPKDWFVIYPSVAGSDSMEVIGLAFNDRPHDAIIH